MDLINSILISIDEAGLRNDLYGTINNIANIVAILIGFLFGMKLKVRIIAVIVSIAAERLLSGYLATAVLFVENGFSATSQLNAAVAFVFVPLIGFLVSKVVRRPWKEIWDVIMPVPIIMFAGARVACTVAGCCYGFPCEWGIYNGDYDKLLFPIQLLESLAAVLIIVGVIWREKKNNFVPDGRNVPIILISYGIARFFLEFLHDNEKIFLGLASTSFHCLIMILVGIITLVIIRRSEATIE